MLIEDLKVLSNKEEVFEQFDKMTFFEFFEFQREIDETVKNEKDSKFIFTNKQIAKFGYEYGLNKISSDLKFVTTKKHASFAEYSNKKIIVNKNDLEDYFHSKDEEFIKEMFEAKARRQLAKISYNDSHKEIKNENSRVNSSYSKLMNKIIKRDYDLNKKYIKETYLISKRKIKEMKILFTFNGELFYQKSKGKNFIQFSQDKKELDKQISKELREAKKIKDKEVSLEKQIEIYQKGIDYSYDWELKTKTLSVKKDFVKEYEILKENLLKEVSIAKEELNSEKNNKKKYLQSERLGIKQLKDEYKTDLNFASTKSELNELKKGFAQEKREVIESNIYRKAKSNYVYKKNSMKLGLKKAKVSYVSSIEDINNTLPVEVPKWKTILAPILGIIPGVGQIINGQTKKGLLMMLLLPIVIWFMLYGFGFANVEGPGILGLIDFGKSDPSSDGRFYLIEGVLAIIFITIAFLIVLGCMLDALFVSRTRNIGIRERKWSQTTEFLRTQGTPYILSFPAIIAIIFVILLPIITTIVIAFTNYGRGNDPARPGQYIEWVGFDNFRDIFGGKYSSSFKYVILWTVLWVLFAAFGAIISGTLGALLVNNDRVKFKGFFRLFFILPWAVPAFIMIMMFSLLFGSENFNALTKKLIGVDGWTNQQTQARVALIFINTWLGQSYIFLLITGIMQGISKDIYEASSIDGANRFKQTFKITIPMVFSQIAPLMLGQFTGAFSNFGLISLYGANGVALAPDGLPYPGEPGITDILISFVYKLSTTDTMYRYGLAASFIIVSSFFVVGISAFGFKNMKVFKN
ncbi:arabinogalactan oligomer/maltooligosaccharide transport system permease protein [Spiroplasma chinense]|uniref:Arabinogalactan oligomer/maltooligosaccharide transport system permease protein n=1 Tax=Spiroplasma chinense TaxID=216932 RepID=A0A5B9Y644_9MOLU|nr:sugar ABC transporter permease [Spiroplasma chinense]QEH62273.1 arabinogalactan oligomer/maltooligosaccharide transport system permease protein [Spiroplasma chinense]